VGLGAAGFGAVGLGAAGFGAAGLGAAGLGAPGFGAVGFAPASVFARGRGARGLGLVPVREPRPARPFTPGEVAVRAGLAPGDRFEASPSFGELGLRALRPLGAGLVAVRFGGGALPRALGEGLVPVRFGAGAWFSFPSVGAGEALTSERALLSSASRSMSASSMAPRSAAAVSRA